jgi:hypothetical protein
MNGVAEMAVKVQQYTGGEAAEEIAAVDKYFI